MCGSGIDKQVLAWFCVLRHFLRRKAISISLGSEAFPSIPGIRDRLVLY